MMTKVVAAPALYVSMYVCVMVNLLYLSAAILFVMVIYFLSWVRFALGER